MNPNLEEFAVPMCDENCNHSHEDTHDQAHTSQENKDLADISRYLEDDGLKDQNPIKLPQFIIDARASTRSKRLEKEKQFNSIKVDKAQVDLLMNELDLSKVAAERLLRSNNGNLEITLKKYIK